MFLELLILSDTNTYEKLPKIPSVANIRIKESRLAFTSNNNDAEITIITKAKCNFARLCFHWQWFVCVSKIT